MKIGDYATISDHRFAKMNIGMRGAIQRIQRFNGKDFYWIKAENYGPYMPSSEGGTRKVRAWIKGNWGVVEAFNLAEITTNELV